MNIRRLLFQNIDYSDLLEDFLVAAVAATLSIRFFLKITGYPQLGGGSLHIAHMLWGGMLMTLAIILLLAFLGREVKQTAAIIAGLGFGTFIDELGKFITSDNNYFYQPTIAIIYSLFVLIYLVNRALQKYSRISPDEYLVNSIELVQESIIKGLDNDEKDRGLRYLHKADPANPVTLAMKNLYRSLATIPGPKPNRLTTLAGKIKALYYSLVKKPWFTNLLIVFFLVQAAASIMTVPLIIFTSKIDISGDFMDMGTFGASFLAGAFTVYGAVNIRRSRLTAYRNFKHSVLISIFLVQFFTFYRDQLSAFSGLVWNILILLALNYMIGEEKRLPA